ncbi:MAG: glycoside hydrolase family 28 protein, partial [Clostridia bacterium]|nr:glycoside hydrolase family 28 protein [Clostridia bacterium]
RPMIYAKGQSRIAITGFGTLEGQGKVWWERFRSGKMKLARPCFICFEDCEDVRLLDFRIQNSPSWTIHPLLCRNVLISGITIVNPADSPNTDGIDPESCQNVRILGCHIDVGDDCIAVKAGTEDAKEAVPCENVVIQGCTMVHGHGGVVLGSEMSGSIRRVVVSGCVFDGTDRGIRIKTRRGRGGIVEEVLASDIVMHNVLCPFVINARYFCGKGGRAPEVNDPQALPVDAGTPKIRCIVLSNLLATGVRSTAMCLCGLPEAPLEAISFTQSQVHLVHAEPEAPAMMEGMDKRTQAGLLARHVKGLCLNGLKVDGLAGRLQEFEEVEIDNGL